MIKLNEEKTTAQQIKDVLYSQAIQMIEVGKQSIIVYSRDSGNYTNLTEIYFRPDRNCEDLSEMADMEEIALYLVEVAQSLERRHSAKLKEARERIATTVKEIEKKQLSIRCEIYEIELHQNAGLGLALFLENLQGANTQEEEIDLMI